MRALMNPEGAGPVETWAWRVAFVGAWPLVAVSLCSPPLPLALTWVGLAIVGPALLVALALQRRR